MSDVAESKKKLDWFVLKRVLRLARPYWKIFAFAIFLAVILAPLAIAQPRLIQEMVDKYVFTGDVGGLTRIALIIFGLLILKTIFRYLFIYYSNLLGQQVVRDLRVTVFSHINSLRLKYFDLTPIGTSTTRTINDIQSINSVFSEGVTTILADLLSIVAVLAIMLTTSWRLTLICLTTMPFLILASYLFKQGVKRSFQQVRTQIQKMNAFLQERITGMRIVQTFGAEQKEASKF
ncbi:MAG: ABC transporter ATP-binding protein, partial [Bacteroidota bacterium]